MIDLHRLAVVLKHANAQPPFANDARADFYRLKEAILRTHGKIVGEDVQHIRKVCWGCGGSGWIEEHSYSMPSDDCDKCRGTGVYSERWIVLERWEMAGLIFHRPVGSTEKRTATIEGLITHRRTRLSFAAQRVLAMVLRPQYWLYLQAFGMSAHDLKRFKAVLAYLLGCPRDRWKSGIRWNDVEEASEKAIGERMVPF